MSPIEIGFLTSGACVIAELVLVYFLINIILARRETKRWEPVRKIVAKQLAETYSSALHTSNQIAKIIYSPIDYPPFEFARIYLMKYRNSLNRLQNLVDLNAAALGSEFMPSAVVFLENAEMLFKKMSFLAEIHNPERKDMDIVGLSPLQEVKAIEDAAVPFKSKYSSLFLEQETLTAQNPPVIDIKAAWDRAAENCNRLCLDPGVYEFKRGIIPYVYDIPSLRMFRAKPLDDGAQVQVCHHI